MSKAEKIIQSIVPINRTGLTFERVENNELCLKMPLEGNANHNGIMYAGSLFALAECAPGVLFMNRYDAEQIAPICANVNIRFRRPAASDVTLNLAITDEEFERLQAEVIEAGKASVEFSIALDVKNGETVAIADVKYVLLKV